MHSLFFSPSHFIPFCFTFNGCLRFSFNRSHTHSLSFALSLSDSFSSWSCSLEERLLTAVSALLNEDVGVVAVVAVLFEIHQCNGFYVSHSSSFFQLSIALYVLCDNFMCSGARTIKRMAFPIPIYHAYTRIDCSRAHKHIHAPHTYTCTWMLNVALLYSAVLCSALCLLCGAVFFFCRFCFFLSPFFTDEIGIIHFSHTEFL